MELLRRAVILERRRTWCDQRYRFAISSRTLGRLNASPILGKCVVFGLIFIERALAALFDHPDGWRLALDHVISSFFGCATP